MDFIYGSRKEMPASARIIQNVWKDIDVAPLNLRTDDWVNGQWLDNEARKRDRREELTRFLLETSIQ